MKYEKYSIRIFFFNSHTYVQYTEIKTTILITYKRYDSMKKKEMITLMPLESR